MIIEEHGVGELLQNFCSLYKSVIDGGKWIIVEQHKKRMAAIVSLDDLKTLESNADLTGKPVTIELGQKKIRRELCNMFGEIAAGKTRIIIMRYNNPAAAIISIDVLGILENGVKPSESEMRRKEIDQLFAEAKTYLTSKKAIKMLTDYTEFTRSELQSIEALAKMHKLPIREFMVKIVKEYLADINNLLKQVKGSQSNVQ